MVVCVHLATLARGTLVRHEVLLLAVLVAAFVGTWAAAALARRRYLAVRTPLVVLLRLAQFAALPLIADVMRVMEPEGVMVSEAAAGGGGGGGRAAAALGAAARLVRAVLLLVMGVGWLHGSAVAALGMQLPPAAHLLVQGVTTLLLCRRATPGEAPPSCRPRRLLAAAQLCRLLGAPPARPAPRGLPAHLSPTPRGRAACARIALCLPTPQSCDLQVCRPALGAPGCTQCATSLSAATLATPVSRRRPTRRRST